MNLIHIFLKVTTERKRGEEEGEGTAKLILSAFKVSDFT